MSSTHDETFVSRQTARGRGAIATIAVHGPDAVECVSACFRPLGTRPFTAAPLGRIVVGYWHDSRTVASAAAPSSAAPGEELVVCRVAESEVEIHSHGGEASVAAVVGALTALGCREIAWDTMPGRPLASGQRIRHDALIALAEAPTLRTAAVLLDQHRGALDTQLRQLLEELRAGQIEFVTRQVQECLDWCEFGEHLTRPWHVVLTGEPNVGKSSLLNALLGFERAVVFDQPGTTRDVVTARTVLEGWPFQLVDTAGLRQTTEQIEADGVARAIRQSQECDLLIRVVDARFLQHEPMPRAAGPGRQLVVGNKRDLLPPQADLPTSVDCWTSATTRQGIDSLAEAIVARLVPRVPVPGTAVPFTLEHRRTLLSLQRQLQDRQQVAALQSLQQLLGD